MSSSRGVDTIAIELRNRIAQQPMNVVETSELEVPVEDDEIKNEYKSFRGRHIQMMSLGDSPFERIDINLGASIGTGMLFESGYSLSIGGPVSLLLAYLWMATNLYAVMARSITSFC